MMEPLQTRHHGVKSKKEMVDKIQSAKNANEAVCYLGKLTWALEGNLYQTELFEFRGDLELRRDELVQAAKTLGMSISWGIVDYDATQSNAEGGGS